MPESKPNSIVVAIDGPAGAGKSTVAQRVADKLGLLYIDTGAMYRAATWLVLQEKIAIDDVEKIVERVKNCNIELRPKDATSNGKVRVFLDGQEISKEVRFPEISQLVSPVSAIPGLRKILVAQQQKLAATGGAVLEGRDIGTVVLPGADVKIFLTATPQVRAERRLKDLRELGYKPDLQEVLHDIKVRDEIDSTRATDPLRQADDAIPLDTDKLTIDQVVERILQFCQIRQRA